MNEGWFKMECRSVYGNRRNIEHNHRFRETSPKFMQKIHREFLYRATRQPSGIWRSRLLFLFGWEVLPARLAFLTSCWAGTPES